MHISLPEFLYPTEAEADWDWLPEMLTAWRAKGKTHLCFPFKNTRPHTLPERGSFWMYMYYRKTITDIAHLKGAVRFRVHVLSTSSEKIDAPDVHIQDFGGAEKIWFLCDRVEEITKADGSLLVREDFVHTEGTDLPSTMRNSIPPVSCLVRDLVVRSSYP